MRPAQFVGGLLLSAALTALVQAQGDGGAMPPGLGGPTENKKLQTAYVARVRDAEADVRAGASSDPKMYLTNRLRQGDLVEVYKVREDGWLEIRPPAGSFSWISPLLLERLGETSSTYVVHSDAPVLLGSNVVEEKPSVIGVRVPRGSQVVAVGLKKDALDGTGFWLPIEPPPDEVRYIRADKVEKADAPPTTLVPVAAVVPETVAPPPATPLAAVPLAAVPPPGLTGFQLKWHQAEQAERDGNNTEAARWYDEVRKETRNTVNHDLALQCDNRIHHLQSRNRGAVVARPASRVFTPSGIATSAQARLFPLPMSPSGQPAPCIPCPLPGSAPTRQTAYGSPTATANADSRVGYLSLAGCPIDGMRAYALTHPEGRIYVTPQPGLDLERYLNQSVELTGPIRYRGDLRSYHLTAQRVYPQ